MSSVDVATGGTAGPQPEQPQEQAAAGLEDAAAYLDGEHAEEQSLEDELAYIADHFGFGQVTYNNETPEEAIEGYHVLGQPAINGERVEHSNNILNIVFTELPDYAGGMHAPGHIAYNGGEGVIHTSNVFLDPATFEGYDIETLDGTVSTDQFDNPYSDLDGMDAAFHEIVHGVQDVEKRDSDAEYTVEDDVALLYEHEGQTAFNTDGESYPGGQAFYELFLDELDSEPLETVSPEDAGAALESISEDYFLGVAHVTDANGNQIYDLIIEDRENLENGEYVLPDHIPSTYDIDIEEVDYRELDAEKHGEHLLDVQNVVNDAYRGIGEDGRTDVLPSKYDAVEEFGYEVSASEIPSTPKQSV